MFREMRRAKQALDQEECAAILTREPRGVLAVHGEDGYPYAIPMDHVYLDGKLYFHCARTGHKLDAIAADARVCYCVMDRGYRKEGEWAWNIKSVVVFGRIRTVEDPARAEEALRRLGQKFFPTPEEVEEEIGKYFHQVRMLELTVDHMTGKLVREK